MKYVLFVCTHNAGRSQMAQAFFERLAPPDFVPDRGPGAADAVWPKIVQAISEVGIDLAARRPKKLDLDMPLHADWAVTWARGTCPTSPRPSRTGTWRIRAGSPSTRAGDPGRSRGTGAGLRRHLLYAVRPTARRTAPGWTTVAAARAGVQRLDGAAVIRACADRYLDADEAPIRSFTFTLAYRDARSASARSAVPP